MMESFFTYPNMPLLSEKIQIEIIMLIRLFDYFKLNYRENHERSGSKVRTFYSEKY